MVVPRYNVVMHVYTCVRTHVCVYRVRGPCGLARDAAASGIRKSERAVTAPRRCSESSSSTSRSSFRVSLAFSSCVWRSALARILFFRNKPSQVAADRRNVSKRARRCTVTRVTLLTVNTLGICTFQGKTREYATREFRNAGRTPFTRRK